MKSILGFIRVCGVFSVILTGVLSLAFLYPFAGRKAAHGLFIALRFSENWLSSWSQISIASLGDLLRAENQRICGYTCCSNFSHGQRCIDC